MVYFFSPSKLIYTLALLQRMDSLKSQLHIASSLAYLSKDREAALQMGSLGTFEALWMLSHRDRDHEASSEADVSDEQMMLHHLVSTMQNLVTHVPRWALLVKDSLSLLHLLRLWAQVPDYKVDTGLALLKIILAVSTADIGLEAPDDHIAPVPSPEASSLLNSALFLQIRQEMTDTQAQLTNGKFDALRLLLDSVLAIHYKLILDGSQNELFSQALELELDVLLALTIELRRLTEDDAESAVADLFEERFIRETFRIIRDAFQPTVEAMHTTTAKVRAAQILSLLAMDELGRFEISQPQTGWIQILSSWTKSTDPQLRLHTAHTLAHLMENDEIGTHIVQQFGFELITSLADIPDLDVQNTVTRMFGRLRGISAAEFDSLSGCVKDFTIDENWVVIESNAASPSRVSQPN